jgi:hypothetical protein
MLRRFEGRRSDSEVSGVEVCPCLKSDPRRLPSLLLAWLSPSSVLAMLISSKVESDGGGRKGTAGRVW